MTEEQDVPKTHAIRIQESLHRGFEAIGLSLSSQDRQVTALKSELDGVKKEIDRILAIIEGNSRNGSVTERVMLLESRCEHVEKEVASMQAKGWAILATMITAILTALGNLILWLIRK